MKDDTILKLNQLDKIDPMELIDNNIPNIKNEIVWNYKNKSGMCN